MMKYSFVSAFAAPEKAARKLLEIDRRERLR